SNRYSTFIGILLALVSVTGAIVAWRVAVASSDAGSADTHGVLAAVDKEEAALGATITVIGHETAYEGFVRDDALHQAFDKLGRDFADDASAFGAAAERTLDFLPRAFLDRNDRFNVQRDLGEEVADRTLNKDVNAQASFDAADKARSKVQWLLFDLIWLGGALLMLTLADAVQNALRHVFLAAGIGIFAVAAVAAVLIEVVSGIV
ncbi:MAG: hypothetical protein ABI874_02645, partial [Chloroflexota bacterium]